MSKLAVRLFVAGAIAVGGFLALTASGTAAEALPPVPTAAANPTAANPTPADDGLAQWQETRLKVPTSNFVAKGKKR